MLVMLIVNLIAEHVNPYSECGLLLHLSVTSCVDIQYFGVKQQLGIQVRGLVDVKPAVKNIIPLHFEWVQPCFSTA